MMAAFGCKFKSRAEAKQSRKKNRALNAMNALTKRTTHSVKVWGQYSQYVADHAQAPHVGVEVDLVKVEHLRGGKLGRAEHHLQLLARIVPAREPEVDDLDPIARLCEAENVFWLQWGAKMKKIGCM